MEPLRRWTFLGTDAEAALDEVTTLAANIAGTDFAMVSLVDADHQGCHWRVGLDFAEAPRDLPFFGHAIQTSAEIFDPGHVLESAVRVLRPTLRKQPVEPDLTQCLSLSARLEGDSPCVQQAVLNLMIHASKPTSPGQGRVTSRYDYVRGGVEVSDMGPGISNEVQTRLLEPFVRATSAGSTRAQVTERSSSICRELIDLVGGARRVQSGLGQGCTYPLTVPLKRLGEPDSPAFADTANDASLLPREVLPVENATLTQKTLTALLAKLVVNVATAPDENAALPQMYSDNFDRVLIDHHLAKTSGPERSSWSLTSVAEGQLMPIAELNANTLPKHIDRCPDSGMDEALPKPVRRQSFER